MPAFARFATAAARGYKPLNAAPYFVRAVESTVTEGGTLNVTWKNTTNNRQINISYSINNGAWNNWSTYGAGTTSASVSIGTNQVNIRLRLQYLSALGNFTNVYARSNAVTTRPYPAQHYDVNYSQYTNLIRGNLGSNGLMTTSVNNFSGGSQQSFVTVQSTVVRDGTTVASNFSGTTALSFTQLYNLITYTTTTVCPSTGLSSTPTVHQQYNGGWSGGSYNLDVSAVSGSSRTLRYTLTGGIASVAYNTVNKALYRYRAYVYCDSCGCVQSTADSLYYTADYTGGQTYVPFTFNSAIEALPGAPYEANEYYNAYYLDQFNNHILGFTSENNYYVGFSYDPC